MAIHVNSIRIFDTMAIENCAPEAVTVLSCCAHSQVHSATVKDFVKSHIGAFVSMFEPLV